METKSLAFVVLVVVAAMWEIEMAGAALSIAECQQEKDLAVSACKPVIYGKRPSPACCERVRVTHFECVCPTLKVKVSHADIKRAVRLIEGCGRSVPHHFKCGSITTP